MVESPTDVGSRSAVPYILLLSPPCVVFETPNGGSVVSGGCDDPDVVERLLEVVLSLPVVVLLDHDVLSFVVVRRLVEREVSMPVGG